MILVNGKTQVAGLIGNPVEHTVSPSIHNQLAQELGLNFIYVPFCVQNQWIDSAVKGLRALNLVGANVTIPYKLDVIPYLDEIDEVALQIGAVNTIVHEDGMLKGYNTDWIGLLRACKRHNIELFDKDIVILGAGGSARAVAVMCCQEKVRSITIINRTIDKANEIGRDLQKKYNILMDVKTYEDMLSVPEQAVCFQTTSIGMYPNITESPVANKAFYQRLAVAVDLIYNPRETLFLLEARAAGVQVMNGLGMLFYQAVKAFEIWHKCQISPEIEELCWKKLENQVYHLL